MLLILKYNKRKPEHQLKRAGYTKRRWGDWILKDTDGRWHLHRLEYGVYSIHYDLTVGDTHYAPYMPLKTKVEIKRIFRKSITTASPMTPTKRDQIQQLMHKYRGH